MDFKSFKKLNMELIHANSAQAKGRIKKCNLYKIVKIVKIILQFLQFYNFYSQKNLLLDKSKVSKSGTFFDQ